MTSSRSKARSCLTQTNTKAAPWIHTWVVVIVEEQPCRRILRLRWWRHTIVTTVAEKLFGEDIEQCGYHLELPPETGRCRHRRRRCRRHGRYRRRRDAAGVILRVSHVTATSGRRCWRDAQTSHFLIIPLAAFAVFFLFFVSVLFVPLSYFNIRVSTLNLYSIRCCFYGCVLLFYYLIFSTKYRPSKFQSVLCERTIDFYAGRVLTTYAARLIRITFRRCLSPVSLWCDTVHLIQMKLLSMAHILNLKLSRLDPKQSIPSHEWSFLSPF